MNSMACFSSALRVFALSSGSAVSTTASSVAGRFRPLPGDGEVLCLTCTLVVPDEPLDTTMAAPLMGCALLPSSAAGSIWESAMAFGGLVVDIVDAIQLDIRFQLGAVNRPTHSKAAFWPRLYG